MTSDIYREMKIQVLTDFVVEMTLIPKITGPITKKWQIWADRTYGVEDGKLI